MNIKIFPVLLLYIFAISACGGGQTSYSADPVPQPPAPVPPVLPPPAPPAPPPAVLAAIAINSGDAQSIPAHTSLPRPLQIVVVDSAGQRMAGVAVSFSAPQGNGANTPATVLTDSAGYGTWMPGNFNVEGTQQVSATTVNYGNVVFSVVVTPSLHQFDGWYQCGNTSQLRPGPFTIEILNGRVISTEQWVFGGTLDEKDGTLHGSYGNDAARLHFTGKLSAISATSATGTGTFYTTSVTMPGGVHVEEGTWTCNRN